MNLLIAVLIAWLSCTLGFIAGCAWNAYRTDVQRIEDEALEDLLDRFDAELREG